LRLASVARDGGIGALSTAGCGIRRRQWTFKFRKVTGASKEPPLKKRFPIVLEPLSIRLKDATVRDGRGRCRITSFHLRRSRG
jgi:hypothetical protein